MSFTPNKKNFKKTKRGPGFLSSGAPGILIKAMHTCLTLLRLNSFFVVIFFYLFSSIISI